jgi:hypothetical protein
MAEQGTGASFLDLPDNLKTKILLLVAKEACEYPDALLNVASTNKGVNKVLEVCVVVGASKLTAR